jgi:hypothetical protein
MADAYVKCLMSNTFNGIKADSIPADTDYFSTFNYYQTIGSVATGITIASCAVIIIMSLCFKFYSEWAEQIVLSKSLFVLAFGVCLYISFHSDGKCSLGLSVATTSVMFGDLLWTMLILGRLVYTSNRPFQQKTFLNSIFGDWLFVFALMSAFGTSMRYWYTRGTTASGWLQCAFLTPLYKPFVRFVLM